MAEALDLSGGDISGYKPARSGPHTARITAVEKVETQSDEGKMPKGTPGYKVTFTIDGGDDDGKKASNRYWIPPADYDPESASKMTGMFAKFLIASGYSEKDVTGGKFKFDPDDLMGRKVTVVLGQTPDRNDPEQIWNTVRNVRAWGGDNEEAGLL